MSATWIDSAKDRLGPLARDSGRYAAVFLAWQLFAFLVFAKVTIFRTESLLNFQDGTIQTYAWMTKNFLAIKSGVIPYWDFSTSSGTSFIGAVVAPPPREAVE